MVFIELFHLINCNLKGANFSGAWLQDNNFEGSDFERAKMNRAFSPNEKTGS